MPSIVVYLTESEYDDVKRLAKSEDKTANKVIVEAIRAFVEVR